MVLREFEISGFESILWSFIVCVYPRGPDESGYAISLVEGFMFRDQRWEIFVGDEIRIPSDGEVSRVRKSAYLVFYAAKRFMQDIFR
jgi:hypothetical protein